MGDLPDKKPLEIKEPEEDKTYHITISQTGGEEPEDREDQAEITTGVEDETSTPPVGHRYGTPESMVDNRNKLAYPPEEDDDVFYPADINPVVSPERVSKINEPENGESECLSNISYYY